MPKRVIDFDAMWGSDKLASCAEWAQAEYAWLYGLADASGCFELTNVRVIWGRVAAIRRNLSIERLEQIFHEFHDKGLLFVWEENGKRYGHWTGSDVLGRLPAPSWRMRLERLAPPVPKQQFAEFMSRFSRGKAASAGGGFFGETLPGATNYSSVQRAQRCEPTPSGVKTPEDNRSSLSCLKARPTKMENSSDTHPRANKTETEVFLDPPQEKAELFSGGLQVQPAPVSGGLQVQPAPENLNDGLEAAQAQDWKWNQNQNQNQNQKREGFAQNAYAEGFGGRAHSAERHCASQDLRNEEEKSKQQLFLPSLNSKSEIQRPESESAAAAGTESNQSARAVAAGNVASAPGSYSRPAGNSFREREKALAVARELMVGRGPRCGPVCVKPEALARMRAREGSRSP